MNEFLKVIRDHYADFRGRARRREYWMFTLVSTLISIVLTGLEMAFGLEVGEGAARVGVLSGLYGLAVLVPGLAVSVRRLHDTGRSGWWLLALLVPLAGAVVLLYFQLLDSQPGANRWGPNPKGQEANAALA